MASEPTNDIIEPEDSESITPAPITPASANTVADASPAADTELPVPIVMEPAEIDERARVIEALNRSEELP